MPPEKLPSALCHYTDWAGFEGIVRDRGFRAFHHLETNDEKELRASDDSVVRVAKTIVRKQGREAGALLSFFADKHPKNALSEVADVFIASFTSERDEGLHWRRYGRNGAGVCMVIKTTDESFDELPGIGLASLKVAYDPTSWERHLGVAFARISDQFASVIGAAITQTTKRRLKQAALVALARVAGMAALSSKVESWQLEKEWRVVAMRAADSTVPVFSAEGSGRRFVLLPGRPQGRHLLLDEILIGPKEDPVLAESRIKEVLSRTGYTGEGVPLPRITVSRHSMEDF